MPIIFPDGTLERKAKESTGIISEDYAHLTQNEKKLLEATLAFRATKNNVQLVLVLFDFTGTDDDHLTVKGYVAGAECCG